MVFGGKKEADMRPSISDYCIDSKSGGIKRIFVRACPQCNRYKFVHVYTYFDGLPYTTLYSVKCGGCGFMGTSHNVIGNTCEEAVVKWNKLKRKGGSK